MCEDFVPTVERGWKEIAMRDRLIELIEVLGKSQMPMVDGLELWADDIADYLLTNGVIVPPCKVGDTVYVMESEFTGFWECEIISMSYDGAQWSGRLNPLWKHHNGGYWEWEEHQFGETIFRTRKEAEQALAKREEEDQ